MIRALRLLLLTLSTLFVAIAFPRESGREFAIAPVWTAPVPARIQTRADHRRGIGIVGEDYWARIDPDTGLSPVSGLRAGRFTMFDGGFLNQSPTAPRWVVQDWSGDALRIVENRGFPRFYDDMLVQFGPREISLEAIPSGDPITLPADLRLSAFSAAVFPEIGRFVATGSIRGEIALYRLEEHAPVRLGLRSIDSSRPAPIYAVTMIPDPDTAHAPALVALRGGTDSQLEFLMVGEEGILRSVARRTVPADARVVEPRAIVHLGGSVVATALLDTVALWDVREERFAFYRVEGATAVLGGTSGPQGTVVFVERRRGWAILRIETDGDTPLLWAFSSGTVVGSDRGRVIVQAGSEIIAIEATP